MAAGTDFFHMPAVKVHSPVKPFIHADKISAADGISGQQEGCHKRSNQQELCENDLFASCGTGKHNPDGFVCVFTDNDRSIQDGNDTAQ